MGCGANFVDINVRRVVVKVGEIGDVGSAEIQDLLFTVKGPTAGALILEWYIKKVTPGSAAIWGENLSSTITIIVLKVNPPLHRESLTGHRRTYTGGRSLGDRPPNRGLP
jgi:hypothetical protein